MARTTKNRRRRWSLVPRIVEFETIDIHVTMDDLMADLDPGWGLRPVPAVADREPARTAA